jgi:hypothetical protein
MTLHIADLVTGLDPLLPFVVGDDRDAYERQHDQTKDDFHGSEQDCMDLRGFGAGDGSLVRMSRSGSNGAVLFFSDAALPAHLLFRFPKLIAAIYSSVFRAHRFMERLVMILRNNRLRNETLFSNLGLAPRLLLAGGAALALATMLAVPAGAQFKTKAQVDLSKPRGMLYPTSIGVGAESYDGRAFDAETVKLLQDAGVTNLRFPGNGGIDALYHFSTGGLTNPYTGDKVPELPAEKQFPHMLMVAASLGSALVTVNYGSNLNGNGPGEPAEAAAWVAYVNGDPASAVTIGKDSKGNDWKTVGYWAGLRAASPLASDDGLNSLRIGQAAPFGVQLWAIGYEPWNDGYYSPDFAAKAAGVADRDADLHIGQVGTPRDWDKHSGDSRLGPGTYGTGVVAFAKAMKAVDPTIQVGASLYVPPQGDAKFGKNWNAEVLSKACGSMDFGTVRLQEGNVTAAPDYKTMDEADLLIGARRDYGLLVQDLLDKAKKSCPAGHIPQLVFTKIEVATWPTIKYVSSTGVFAADTTATLIENGAYSVEWSPLHSILFLTDKDEPKPAYYGVKMVHLAAGAPGGQFVTTSSQQPSLAVHAIRRADGGLGILLVNKDPQQSNKVTISVNGYNFATKGTRYDWGQVAVEGGKGISEAPIDGLGASFTVDVPRYGVTAIVIPKQ